MISKLILVLMGKLKLSQTLEKSFMHCPQFIVAAERQTVVIKQLDIFSVRLLCVCAESSEVKNSYI